MPERIQVPLNFNYQTMLGKFFPTPQPQAESMRTTAEPKTAIETEIGKQGG
jgi:hypothetical protein